MSRLSLSTACVVVATLCVPARSQEQGKPTPEDLKIMVTKWTQLTAPDQLLSMNPNVVLIFERDDIKTVVDARKKGEEEDAKKELVAKRRADIITSQTEVRLLDTFQVLCFVFKALGTRCAEVQDTLAGLYNDVYSTKPAPPGITEAQREKTRGVVQRRFVAHDISNFIDGTYALVRIVSGGDPGVAGTRGWVPLDQLRPFSKH